MNDYLQVGNFIISISALIFTSYQYFKNNSKEKEKELKNLGDKINAVEGDLKHYVKNIEELKKELKEFQEKYTDLKVEVKENKVKLDLLQQAQQDIITKFMEILKRK